VTVSTEWLFTEVARVSPLNSTTEEDTKLPPFAVSVKLDGNCENVRVGGEIELRTGTGRALPHSGFTALQAGRNQSASTSALRRAVNGKGGINTTHPQCTGSGGTIRAPAAIKATGALKTHSDRIFGGVAHTSALFANVWGDDAAGIRTLLLEEFSGHIRTPLDRPGRGLNGAPGRLSPIGDGDVQRGPSIWSFPSLAASSGVLPFWRATM